MLLGIHGILHLQDTLQLFWDRFAALLTVVTLTVNPLPAPFRVPEKWGNEAKKPRTPSRVTHWGVLNHHQPQCYWCNTHPGEVIPFQVCVCVLRAST